MNLNCIKKLILYWHNYFFYIVVNRTRICVKNLPKYVAEDRLRELFSQKGEITDAKLMRTKYNSIYLYIFPFYLFLCWIHCLSIFSSYGLVLKILFVFTLFVGFFRNSKSSSFFFFLVFMLDSLFVIFSSYGLVLKVCVCVFDSFVGFFRNGKSRQFAFIGFRTEREAGEAIKYFNKSYIDTFRITCEVRIAVSFTVYYYYYYFKIKVW